MIILGITLGLAASICQSLSYLYSRLFLKRCGDDWRMLLALSQILMGGMAAAVLPFFAETADIQVMRSALIPAILAAVFYFMAQGALFSALKWTEASRVSPLLGLKVVAIALIASMLGKQQLAVQHWVAVVLSGSAAFFLNEIGGRMPGRAILFVCLTVAGYSLSDMNIKELLVALEPAGREGPFIAVCLAYIVSGICGTLMLFRTGLPGSRAWMLALPHALTWIVSMFLFSWSLVFIDLVFAVIVQATRGLASIWLGVLVSKLGHEHIEKSLSQGIVWKRAAAAVLMVLAIVLYSMRE